MSQMFVDWTATPLMIFLKTVIGQTKTLKEIQEYPCYFRRQFKT